jgi:hypothetical protein
MKKTQLLAALLSLSVVSAAFAEFEAVHTFETGGTDGITFGTSPIIADGGNGSITVIDDPYEAGNKVLELTPGVFANGTDTNNTWFDLPFPAITGKGTVYTRVAKKGDIVDIVIGTTHVAVPAAYGDFSSIFRIEADTIIDYHDGSYTEVAGSSTEAGKWYELWIVIDTPANTYDLWVKGGNVYPTATKIASGADFRSNSTDAQNRFYARMTAGSALSPKAIDNMLFDDIYVDLSGENISTPGSTPVGTTPDGNIGSVGTGYLANIATRAFAGTGDQVLTAGFVIRDNPRRVLIRGVGPTLGGFGVAGTIVDPTISVFPGGGTEALFSNDNWGDSSVAAEITSSASTLGAFPLDAGSADAAMVVTLNPGSYTVQVGSATAGGTGVALIEVYEIR